jgi:ApaG protein
MIDTVDGHKIEVEARTTFVPEQSDPARDRYFFAYTITIRNTGSVPAQLRTRHWIITDSNGRQQEVQGEGVVGEQPHLRPGESFQYTSAAMIETPVGTMHGSYQMVADDGTEFDAPISPFRLALKSQSLH